jgi:hypothetical protein
MIPALVKLASGFPVNGQTAAGTSASSASYSVGAKQVAYAIGSSFSSTSLAIANTSITGGTLTWTSVTTVSNAGSVTIWKGTPSADLTGVVTQFSWSGSTDGMIAVYVFDNASQATGAFNSAGSGVGAAAVTVAGCRANSYLLTGMMDGTNNLTAVTPDGTTTTEDIEYAPGDIFWTGHKTALTTAGSNAVGTTTPTGHQWCMAAVEVMSLVTVAPSVVIPNTAPRINWEHPLAKSIVALFVPAYGELKGPNRISAGLNNVLLKPSVNGRSLVTSANGDLGTSPLTNDQHIQLGVNSLTFVAWLDIKTLSPGAALLGQFDSTNVTDSFLFSSDGLNGNTGSFSWYDSGGVQRAVTTSAATYFSTVDGPSCYAVSRRGGVAFDFYKNGAPFGTSPADTTSNAFASSGDIWNLLGGQIGGASLIGSMPMAAIFNRALTATEHAELAAYPMALLDFGGSLATDPAGFTLRAAPAAPAATAFQTDAFQQVTLAFQTISSGPTTYNDSISEASNATDSLVHNVTFENSLSESSTAADSLVHHVTFANSLTEASTAADTLTNVCTFPNSLSESSTAADSLSPNLVVTTTLTEAATAADSLTPNLSISTSLSEASSAADSFTNAVTWGPSISEASNAADAFATIATFPNSLTEAATAADSLTNAVTFANSITEASSATDSFVAGLLLSATLSEASTAADSLANAVTWGPALTEASTAADSFATIATFPNSLTEASSATDTLANVATFPNSLSEASNATDSVTAGLNFVNSITEASTAADSLANAVTWGTSLTEAATAADSLANVVTFANSITEASERPDSICPDVR